MIDSYGFMDTELAVDDVLDFCLSSGDTKSKFHIVPNGDREFDLYEGATLRMMSFIADKELVTQCFDDNGELNDWGSRPAVTYRNPETFDHILSEHWKNGTQVHKLMRVPFKSDFDALD